MELLSHKIAHISGNVGPTLLQHPSNRSSLRPRPEKHIRGSLSCPWYTGEPEAPVLGVTDTWKLAQFGSRGPKMTKRQKVDIFGSVLSDFAVFLASPVKYEKNAAFGSHLALSVLQIRLGQPGRSPSVHHYRLTETLPSSLSHHFFSDFLVVNHSGKINGTY